MSKFEYTVVTKASPALAWLVFSDWHRWNHFANVYGEIRWREGRPWEPGSLMQIELLRPVHALIDHVITTCMPAKKVSWIDHALGVAMAQWVTFEEHSQEGTVVRTWGEVLHSGIAIGGHTVEELLASFTRTWYESFRQACDRLVLPGGTVPEQSSCAVQ
ncbi:MAG TPA: hypothetical protein VJN42_05720 [Candidatus Acidoferrum sp.]|nr:hypothetical protein [Candidatus Acidoferrum sp.]